ncbi:unnamed protein product [Adineta ricciae]|uniref:DUF4378 domain-containing protein n=1 Tax=Adineta ricciae TaxID=249248 RepID=A0A813NZW8_ADIRI|nr:unnamed protein product [Adineta ricciae]
MHLSASNSSSIYTSHHSAFDDDQSINRKRPLLDLQARENIQRKISRQKLDAEQRNEHSNSNHTFESVHPHTTNSISSSLQNLHHRQHSPLAFRSLSSEFDTALRHPSGSRLLHGANDVIFADDLNYQPFNQPQTRKITKITPKENLPLSYTRPSQPRATSAINTLAKKPEPKDRLPSRDDAKRLKSVRRLEPAHVSSGPGSKTSLINTNSWKTDPSNIKKPSTVKKPKTEITTKAEDNVPPTDEQFTNEIKQEIKKLKKPKRDKSATKTMTERPLAKPHPPPKPEKTKEEKKKESEKIQKYIKEKQQEHEKKILNDKELKNAQEKERKERLIKLNEQIKKVAQQPLPASLTKKSSTSNASQSKDPTELTRERLLHLLGPKPVIELPVESRQNAPSQETAIRERSTSASSSSSKSSSTDSVVEIQPPKTNDQTVLRAHSEPPIQDGNSDGISHRNQNLLRWAYNLTRDCNDIETKFKFFRPDGTQPFDIIPPSREQLQHDTGNLRIQPPIIIKKREDEDEEKHEPTISAKLLRPSGRLSHLNQNNINEYGNQRLPGVGDLRDPILEQRVKRDYAATKIQSTYRGYQVRKALQWSNQKQQRLNSEFNRRPSRKPTKVSSYRSDIFDSPGTNFDLRFSDDKFTIGSTILRKLQQNGTNIQPAKNKLISERYQRRQPLSTHSSPPPPSSSTSQKIQRPTVLQTYSDDYENYSTTTTSTPASPRPAPEKPRVTQQPMPARESFTSPSPSSSTPSSSSFTPTHTPEPPVASTNIHRRSISPPLPLPMSPDSGRAVHQRDYPSHVLTHAPSSTTHRISDERRYSPDALERQLNAELHLLDGVEASMKQVENMERLRSVALAQQEVVSLAQVLRNKPIPESTTPSQPLRKSPAQRSVSSSSSSSSSSTISNRKHRPSSPQPKTSTSNPSRQRRAQSSTSPTSSSSESILPTREKRVRQKYHNEAELQAYEARLKDIEKKVRQLTKRAFESLNAKRTPTTTTSSQSKPKSSNDSSISEDIPDSQKSTSVVQKKTNNDTSEIRTETNVKDSISSSISFQQEQSGKPESVLYTETYSMDLPIDTVTTDVSDLERRVRNYRDQLKAKRTELDKLKQKKTKEELREQEDELKKQLQTFNHEIEVLRHEPPRTTKALQEQKQSVSVRKVPVKSSSSVDSSSSSSSASTASTATKPQESSIAEDLPVTTTASQSKTDLVEKRIEPNRSVPKKERDFFDDDDDDDEEKQEEAAAVKPMETPREERDTQHDAQSISIATDLAALSQSEDDDSHKLSTDNEKPILNLNKNPAPLTKTRQPSESSSSTTTTTSETTTSSKRSSKNQAQSQTSERKASSTHNDYDEDFSDVSHSPTTPTKEPLAENKVIDLDCESIHEDFEEKQSTHDINRSLSSKSSGDEQSEILVLVKKSASTTPRKQEDKTLEEELPPPLPIPASVPAPISVAPEPKLEPTNNDDTAHDISDDDDDDEDIKEQENRVDHLTDQFIRAFIDEAIDQGREIKRLKKEINKNKDVSPVEPFAAPDTQEWLIENDANEDNNQDSVEINEFTLDFSQLDEKNPNEPRIESPRKIVVEEPVQIYVPHTREQVIDLCHKAMEILYDQNTDFSDREAIQCYIPVEYLTSGQQDSDNEHVRLNRRAYCRMVFDLCTELLHEMDTPNVIPAKYSDWQHSKLVSKRFFRGRKPASRHEVEQFIQTKVLEVLGLTPRQITYSKWRVPNDQHHSSEKFETVLDQEIRRGESQWIAYDDDCIKMKFEIADLILDQLVQESISECLSVTEKRLFPSSNSTRL